MAVLLTPRPQVVLANQSQNFVTKLTSLKLNKKEITKISSQKQQTSMTCHTGRSFLCLKFQKYKSIDLTLKN